MGKKRAEVRMQRKKFNTLHMTLVLLQSCTLSLRLVLDPDLRRDLVVATSPLSAEKKRADHPVL